MKKTVLILSLCALMFAADSADAGRKLLFSTFESAFVTDDVAEAVLREAYQRVGMDIAVEKFPDKRAIFMAEKGVTDGELFRIADIGKGYPHLIMIPVPVSFFEGVVFTKHADFEVKGWDSLKPYRIGVIRGIMFSDRATEKMDRRVFDGLDELFVALDKGGIIDIGLYARLDGQVFFSRHFKGKTIRVLEPPLVSLPLYNYLHERHKNLVPKITSVLEEMEKEGMIRKIIRETEKALSHQPE